MKQSPYFFMRQQAEKKLQAYSMISTVLLLVTFIAGITLLRPNPQTSVVLAAPISNTKPASDEVRSLVEAAPTNTIDLLTNEGVDLNELMVADSTQGGTSIGNAADLLEQVLVLPAEFDRFTPSVELQETTEISPLAFSTRINDEYQAVNPTSLFAAGSYTLYATFAYDGMQDGMVWSWVWRRDGQVVDGGNEEWVYGIDGPGYIYYNPEEGFSDAEYSLEVWVNGELFTQSDIIVNTAAATANN